MPIESYLNLVIGSGAGGKIAAWSLARQGQRTVVVERSMIGGSSRSMPRARSWSCSPASR